MKFKITPHPLPAVPSDNSISNSVIDVNLARLSPLFPGAKNSDVTDATKRPMQYVPMNIQTIMKILPKKVVGTLSPMHIRKSQLYIKFFVQRVISRRVLFKFQIYIA